MPTITEATVALQEQSLEAIKRTQDAYVDAVQTWAKTASGLLPEVPAVPFADEVPNPQVVLNLSFDYAEKLLGAQRQFAQNLLAATAPIVSKTQQ
jgi:hypothetical protein